MPAWAQWRLQLGQCFDQSVDLIGGHPDETRSLAYQQAAIVALGD